MSDPILKLEETVAHLSRMFDELSDVVARQEAEIERLVHRVEMLMQREADQGGTATLTDQKPPHW
jgi:SlyX protein